MHLAPRWGDPIRISLGSLAKLEPLTYCVALSSYTSVVVVVVEVEVAVVAVSAADTAVAAAAGGWQK